MRGDYNAFFSEIGAGVFAQLEMLDKVAELSHKFNYHRLKRLKSGFLDFIQKDRDRIAKFLYTNIGSNYSQMLIEAKAEARPIPYLKSGIDVYGNRKVDFERLYDPERFVFYDQFLEILNTEISIIEQTNSPKSLKTHKRSFELNITDERKTDERKRDIELATLFAKLKDNGFIDQTTKLAQLRQFFLSDKCSKPVIWITNFTDLRYFIVSLFNKNKKVITKTDRKYWPFICQCFVDKLGYHPVPESISRLQQPAERKRKQLDGFVDDMARYCQAKK